METLFSLLASHGVAIVFAAMLIEQLGIPLPAYPLLLVSAALGAEGHHFPVALFGWTLVACLLPDCSWYMIGRSHGFRVLGTVCKISITPDTCVRETYSLFERWGLWALLVSKFLPGFSTIANALAGSSRVRLGTFLIVNFVGSAFYVGVGIWLGFHFHLQITELVEALESLGRLGFALIIVALVLFVGARWWQRQRLIREFQGDRITVAEVRKLLDEGGSPTFVDVRPASHRRAHGAIPNAHHVPLDHVEVHAPRIPRDAEVVVYCECPNEVSAAQVARVLRKAGIPRVRPLEGGLAAWIASGLPIVRPT